MTEEQKRALEAARRLEAVSADLVPEGKRMQDLVNESSGWKWSSATRNATGSALFPRNGTSESVYS